MYINMHSNVYEYTEIRQKSLQSTYQKLHLNQVYIYIYIYVYVYIYIHIFIYTISVMEGSVKIYKNRLSRMYHNSLIYHNSPTTLKTTKQVQTQYKSASYGTYELFKPNNHRYIHAYIHTYINTYIHAYI
jgi:hypothetical protein